MALRNQFNMLTSIGNKLCAVLTWLPPLVARVTIGVVFVQSGWGKLNNLPTMIERFRGWGIPAPEIQTPLAAGSELIFGAFVLIGLLTRFSTIPLMIVMVVAMYATAYEPAKAIEQGTFNYLFGLTEYLYIVILLWLAVFGPGRISVDHIFLSKTASSS